MDDTTNMNTEQPEPRDAAWWEALARNAWAASTTYFDAFVRPAVEEGIRQFQSRHSHGSKYLTEQYRLKSKIFRPMTRKAIRKHEAAAARALFSTEDVVSVRAADDADQLQQQAAAAYRMLLQRRLTRDIPWFQLAMGAYQETMACGVVASLQDWEMNQKKGHDRPRITLIPPENVRIDPAATWTDPVNSSPYVIYMIPLYLKDVKGRMKSGTWHELEESVILGARQNQNDSTRIVREGASDSKDQTPAVTDFTVVWVHMNIVEVDGEDWLYYTMGTRALLTEPKPLKEVYFHGRRPIVLGNCIVEAHKVYPSSFARLVKPMNDEAIDLANLRHDNIKLMLNPRHQALRNRNVDLRSITRNVAGSVTMVSGHEDVKTVDTRDATGSSFAEQDRLNAEFDDLAGGFSGSSVATNRNLNETVGGMNLLTASQDMVADYQMRTWIETWVEPVLRQLLELEREYETNQSLLRLAAQAAGVEQVGDDVLYQDVTLSVNVGIGNTNPQNQVDRFVYGLTALSRLKPEMLQRLKDEEIVKEIFGKLGYKDGARFFDFQAETGDPLEAQIKQATLEKLQAEIEQIKSTSAVKAVEAMVKRVEVLYSSMQSAQTAATVPGVVPIADEIAKSAGFVDQNESPIYQGPVGSGQWTADSGQWAGNSDQGAADSGQTQVPGPRSPVPVPHNTDPRFPAHPAGPGEGMMQGIETQRGEDNIR